MGKRSATADITPGDTQAVLEGRGSASDQHGLHSQGATLSFHDINYYVEVKDKGKTCGKEEKQILKNIR